jgi:hypothetical protein
VAVLSLAGSPEVVAALLQEDAIPARRNKYKINFCINSFLMI